MSNKPIFYLLYKCAYNIYKYKEMIKNINKIKGYY